MTLQATTRETAAEAYNRLYTEATALATRIADSLVNDPFPTGYDRDWGNAGDMGQMVEALRLIADRRFHEGEHAPE